MSAVLTLGSLNNCIQTLIQQYGQNVKINIFKDQIDNHTKISYCMPNDNKIYCIDFKDGIFDEVEQQ